jgi:hypothetical protein
VSEHTLEMLQELTDLRSRVAELEREQEESRRHRPDQSGRTARDHGGMSRRRLLGLLGGAATGAGVLVAETLGADRAHAADGDALIIGQTNTNDDPGGTTALHGSIDQQGGAAPLLDVISTGAIGNGVRGLSTGSGVGVDGTSDSGPGVTGSSTSGPGVDGASFSSDGVRGFSTSSFGLRGESSSSAGVFGFSSSGLDGVAGRSESSNSIMAFAPQGTSPGAHLFLQRAGVVGPPTSGFHQPGQFWMDGAGVLFQCVAQGTPGTWVRQAPFVPLTTPSRVYDSRVGRPNPSGSPQGPLAFGDPARTINCSPEVPAGASAILFNVTVTDTAGKFGALVVFSAASPDPSTNSVVWTSQKSTECSSAASACDGSQDVKVKCVASPGCSTEFMLDVTGYYT